MQINVSGKQVDLSDALRTRVWSGLDTIAGKYFDHAIEARVIFGRARSFFTCDINVHAGRGLTLRGEGEAGDANAAFDDAAAHIATRLRRYRRRMSDHHRDLANREKPVPGRSYVLEPQMDDRPDDAPETPHNGHAQAETVPVAFATIIAESTTDIARLSVSEAVMRMDLEDQPVMMFRNSTTSELNVVYRRPDGNIGWIDPSGRA